MIVGTQASARKPQAVLAQPLPDPPQRGLRLGVRQPSAAPTVLGLVVALIAAVLVATSTARWASSAVALPSSEGLRTGLGQHRPERHLVGATPVEAQASNCGSLSAEFSALKDTIRETMGQALECPHVDPSTGDTLQRTSTGLAIYRNQSRTATFTDGYRRWAIESRGLTTWEGDALDPPEAPR